MESKLIDMISMGVLIYTLILLLDNIRNKNIVKKVLKIYKSNIKCRRGNIDVTINKNKIQGKSCPVSCCK